MGILINHKNIADILINIHLVSKGGRDAMLIESTNITKDRRYEDLQLLKNIVAKLGLVQITENEEFGRYLVTTVDNAVKFLKAGDDDVVLGKLLGFACAEHDYWDMSIDRIRLGIQVNIKGFEPIEIIVEMCDANQIGVKDLENHANKVIRRLEGSIDLSYSYTIDLWNKNYDVDL